MINLKDPFKIITLSLQWITFMLLLSRSVCGSNQNHRLPGDIKPDHYDIDILANLDDKEFSYQGKVKIKIKCLKETNKIVLHSFNIAIHTDALKLVDLGQSETSEVDQTFNQSNPIIQVAHPTYDTNNEFFIVQTKQPLQSNHLYEYEITYNGTLNTNLFGFYRSSYIDKSTNETRWLALTQFSPIHARKAFPCFDEPGMKATFTISLRHRDCFTALSNMPVEVTNPLAGKAGWSKTQFKKTVRMSTYLVGFMVSDFEHLPPTKTDNTGIPFQVWARRDALEQTKFGGFIGPRLLSFLEKYFGINFPLPKQDIAAIPDFYFNAMENWGLITFRETAILYDQTSTSVSAQQDLTFTTAHEIAHQWFGNLVTMNWWTDLWLKEGFASYLGAIAIEDIFPEWKEMSLTVTSNLVFTFALDSLNSSHPVSVPIGDPKEIPQLFDKIPYAKGPLIIRMMHHFLGDEAFREGLESYLRRFAYSNAEKDDLWHELTLTAHQRNALPKNITVNTVMDTWTIQTGFPLVTVQRNYGKGTAAISQARYLEDTSPESNTCKEQYWWVPLSFTSRDKLDFTSTKPKTWLSNKKSITLENLPDENNWIVFNIKATGPFRVNYDLKNWELLTATLKNPDEFKLIDPLNRMLLTTDSFSLAYTGRLPYDLVLRLATYLSHETEYTVWSMAANHLADIRLRIRTSEYNQSFESYVQDILRPVYQKLGPLSKATEGSEESLFKSMIVSMAKNHHLDIFEEEATALFAEAMSGNNYEAIPKDIRGAVYCAGIRDGDNKVWKTMWDRYVSSNVGAEKDTILTALGCSQNAETLRGYLDWSIDDSKVRRQDSVRVFNAVATGGRLGPQLAKSHLIHRYVHFAIDYAAGRVNYALFKRGRKEGTFEITIVAIVMSQQNSIVIEWRRLAEKHARCFEICLGDDFICKYD